MERQTFASASWLSSWWLQRAMESTRPYARGILLDVGCGVAPYRGFYSVDRHITCDWPGTVHDRRDIDVYASADALPFARACCDTVLCTEVLEHLKQPAVAIAEAARVLRPGGHLILSVPFLYGIHEQPVDFFRFTEHGLRALLVANDLEPVHLQRRGGSVSVVSDLSAKLVQRVTRRTMNAMRFPSGAQRAVLAATVETPQRLVAFAAGLAERALPRASALVGASTVATLGYVVVARRGDA
ncbi:MAG TPA: class I SAM-dependent methyltransferase [Kofleriaceae bacterium]